MLNLLRRKLISSANSSIFLASKIFMSMKSSATPPPHVQTHFNRSFCCSSQKYIFHRKNPVRFATPKFSSLIYRWARGYGYASYAVPIPRPITHVDMETADNQLVDQRQLAILQQKLQQIGIDRDACVPGKYNGLLCPRCKGGSNNEKSLSLHITNNGETAMWTCFRATCGWKGVTGALAGVKSTYETMNKITFAKPQSTYETMNKITIAKPQPRVITQESLELEPLCTELLAYFADRMISGETLRRNAVMQKRTGDKVAIAFCYLRNGELVSCKYRCITKKFYRRITKKFWQEANTERIFYGLDDIKGASDIIIVEGEMDKLAMEEAGLRNCVGVPDGAPPKVSNKAIPPEEQDTSYQYLWNCKEYTAKASRIILATDADLPGQALAEELARRLGRERCWRVKWPKKNADETFKDANEVLMYMGPDALKEAVENAELYPIKGLFNF